MTQRPVDWYESEDSTRRGLVIELQRIRRRASVRPIPVLLLAAVITTLVTYKIATKPRIYLAEVVLALDEGSSVTSRRSIPFDQLKGYVTQVLMPDGKLTELIQKRNLNRLRTKLGDQFALGELRDQVEIEIWKNSFLYYTEDDEYSHKSARIGITVSDGDPDQAFDLAHDLASIAIETHEEQRRKIADRLANELRLMRSAITDRAIAVNQKIIQKRRAIDQARTDGRRGIAAALQVDLSPLYEEQKRLAAQINLIAQSPEAIVDQLTRAGYDTTLSVVDERRPERQEQSAYVLILIIVIVGTGALLGSAVFVGAFDARIHDTDDVARLGLPVLGHVPGFAGDTVGSLEARGALRRRVPSFLRWRSHQ